MTTEEFLYCFRRFIAVRGTPSTIISDNATQFKLGSDVVNLVWKQVIKSKDVQNYISSSSIHWKFITEFAPWMGGFYERLVGLVKRSFRKTLNRKLLSEVQLLTIVKEIEAVVNSRPLVYVGDDINSRITPSPSHFLTLNPNIGVPEVVCDLSDPSYTPFKDSSDKLLKIWKKGQRLLDSFWQMWREEYLMSLRERMQSNLKCGRVQSKFSPNIGDVVLIKDSVPRGLWKLGKIVSLTPSNDNEVRSVKIQLASGKVVGRPLCLLYPLETGSNKETETKDYSKEKTLEMKATRQAAVKARQKIKEVYKD